MLFESYLPCKEKNTPGVVGLCMDLWSARYHIHMDAAQGRGGGSARRRPALGRNLYWFLVDGWSFRLKMYIWVMNSYQVTSGV